MKELFLIRHAKSSWNHPSLRDFDRPLNKRGEAAAPAMGEDLKERGILPDVIISSPAVRALTTAKIIARELGYPEENIQEEPAIYEASSQELIRVINGIDEAHQSAMLFGHNPGFHDVANALLSDEEYVEEMPTCAVVMIRFQDEHWGSIGTGDGELVFHTFPRDVVPNE